MAMNIVSVNPYFNNPAAQDTKGTNITQSFLVLFDDFLTASAADLQLASYQAITAGGIPVIGDQFRANKSAFCKTKGTQLLNEGNKPVGIIVICNFSTIASEEQDETENPLDKRPDISWTPTFEREAVMSAKSIQIFQGGKDIEKKEGAAANGILPFNDFELPVQNSFGGNFSTQPEKDVPYQQFTVVENLATYDISLALELLQTINKSEFTVDGFPIPKHQCLITQRSGVRKYSGKLVYYEVTTTGLLKGTHAAVVIDNGNMAYEAASKVYQSGIDDGTPTQIDGVDAIKPLDGKGNELAQGSDPVFLHFGVYNEAEHSRLKLPTRRL